ncbi:Rho-binding antiterminator [Photobacterium sp. TY1-4]|uniref:Rho-binding antiterminator n=1 Tax=Photobacterium sp. TY1-4 TaxID=2899122 RepID=UPI0021BE99CF|nr:Rho-binding antiterminator [Photobacterium sp. TY1-4]UXI04406.1 Rho-binding antiterminator [Photobacterium sp. TY1-4]
MTHPYQPIDCSLYDYFEMACLFHYQVRLALADSDIIEGRCLDTQITPDKSEWLLLEISPTQRTSIRLDQIRQMTALTPGARFSTIAC